MGFGKQLIFRAELKILRVSGKRVDMQDRYVGDIGDYIKLALLRKFAERRAVGIAWYRTSDSNNNDGRHIDYLKQDRESIWGHFDPELYDKLRILVHGNRRKISELECLLPPTAVFHKELLDSKTDRSKWFEGILTTMAYTDLVFLDPDNGVSWPSLGVEPRISIQSARIDEIQAISKNSGDVILYHHQTRRPGGHELEIADLGKYLAEKTGQAVCALRAKCWSPRVFLLVAHWLDTWKTCEAFAAQWEPHVRFIPITEPPMGLDLPPESPYSDRAERTERNFGKRLAAGEFPELFDPTKDYRKR